MFASFFVLQFSCYPSRLTFLLHESTSFRIPSNESLLAGGELLVFDYLKISWFCLDYFLKFFFFNVDHFFKKSLLNLLQYCFCCLSSSFLTTRHVGSQLPEGNQTGTPYNGRRNFNHRTTREVPWLDFLNNFVRYNSHTIKFTHFKYRIQRLLVYSPVQQLSQLNLRINLSAQRKTPHP